MRPPVERRRPAGDFDGIENCCAAECAPRAFAAAQHRPRKENPWRMNISNKIRTPTERDLDEAYGSRFLGVADMGTPKKNPHENLKSAEGRSERPRNR